MVNSLFLIYLIFRLAQAVKLMLALAIYITHPLQMYVAVDITWNQYLGSFKEQNKHPLIWDYVIRTVLVALTCK